MAPEDRRPRVGLLPFYIKLYDEVNADWRAGFAGFLQSVAEGLQAQGLDVETADICRVEAEFDQATKKLEACGVDCLITLHLAYSPSMEAVIPLTKTTLPLILLDTTMDHAFGQDTPPSRIMYNHGIHGVMDFASVLRRCGRPYRIVAGHLTESDVLERAAEQARAAFAWRSFHETRALRIGDSFQGMGDFYVEPHVLGRVLGVRVDGVEPAHLTAAVEAVTPAEVEAELADDRRKFDCRCPEESHRRSVRIGLGLRQLLAAGGYGAFSMNFMAFRDASGPVNSVPFLEASKAMARGIGYAGEGDVVTAALVGALQRAFGQTSFTEVFCPDWRGDSLFLSHMGEINPAVAGAKPRLVEKPFPYTAALPPALLACAPRPGPATLVNLSPGPEHSFRLIAAPVEVLDDTEEEAMKNLVRGWIRPRPGAARFLEKYSELGGTHHSALIMGEHARSLAAMAAFAGMEYCLIA